MKAALKTQEGTFEVREVDQPELPGPDWVLVRVRIAGICGTDLRHWRKHEADLAGHIMGHELAGDVVAVGDAVSNVAVGDRVVAETVLGCGHCEYCRARQYNICPDLYATRRRTVSRAYGQFLVAPASHIYRLPQHISFEEAALVDTFSVCLHAQHLSGLTINDRVAVIGAGPIGLGQLMLAKASGADMLIVDRVASSLAVAQDLGADLTVNPEEDDPVAAIKAFTGGRGADIVFECAGGTSMPQTLPLATQMVRRGGKVVIIGGFDAGVTEIGLEWQRIQMSEIQLIPTASFAWHRLNKEQGEVVELIGKGKLDAKRLITHRFPLDRINEAFACGEGKAQTGAVFIAIEM
ncbi:zinc-binding dehydrogenase [Novosphingobium sp. 9U]|uniref:zinc-dependent alcohol dehydrogenase n=1 Tax=Novosphingobium sp. 9U TaxID=2653158 RepID=UPI0012EFEE8D|nr:alcohol dehydrogenase catalytic domain-containing protein [Novosphingobium sp. 9U]VWX55137.1 putative Sorbitol dehydrogenase [Novosphingobium sp. 9U]